MPSVSNPVQINKPVAQVFDFFADSSNWPGTAPDVVSVKPSGGISKGTKGTMVRKMGGRATESQFKVTEFEQNKKIIIAGSGGGMKYSAAQGFAASGDGTQVTFQLNYSLQGWMKILQPVVGGQVKKSVNREMQGLKKAIEARK